MLLDLVGVHAEISFSPSADTWENLLQALGDLKPHTTAECI